MEMLQVLTAFLAIQRQAGGKGQAGASPKQRLQAATAVRHMVLGVEAKASCCFEPSIFYNLEATPTGSIFVRSSGWSQMTG